MCHRRAAESCCENHTENGGHALSNHQYSVANLVNNIRPMMITSAELEVNGMNKKNACQKTQVENSLKVSGNNGNSPLIYHRSVLDTCIIFISDFCIRITILINLTRR